MPSPEQGGVPPEKPSEPEEHTVYLKAACFVDGMASQRAYIAIHQTIRVAQQAGEVRSLAGYHLTDQDKVRWYVAVVGEQPNKTLEAAFSSALARGEPGDLPRHFQDLLTRHYANTREEAMTLDEWLAADGQGDAA
jgi:hypothetical protein